MNENSLFSSENKNNFRKYTFCSKESILEVYLRLSRKCTYNI